MAIDFRSDTVTRPSKAMLDFMIQAPVGDDVYEEDPTVNELEKYTAEHFGFEAGLYCSSGTQTNQIALKVHTQPGDEIICHEESHIYRYEGGGMMINSQASPRFIRGNNGRIIPELLQDQINPDDIHYPVTKLVSLEDTANRGGGAVYDFNDILKIKDFCTQNNLKLHLDGARVFNALAVNQCDPKVYGKPFDSISICLSKGLGAPVGSVLLGSKDFIHKARRVRKYLGGGMRQAGIIAAGGLYALKNNVHRLIEDHQHASLLEKHFKTVTWVAEVLPVTTNIVVLVLKDATKQNHYIAALKAEGILVTAFGKGRIRFVTHLNISSDDIQKVCQLKLEV
ncbi:low-specificity L-threonine aldolase [Putridiphycobacter roseus]|uniref:Low-specificity L-threonine aldolase n=1 Tax=Putridiphycobacter roseus TaxID=2219161 RepID=A0A2W1MXD9_9FLAO|nr:low-specificity L-threonine aldolase [Putridiphycobacter roseus]PZE16034.1 low-specificity L-threonine aldolase [Putridiphycobacter roseus]